MMKASCPKCGKWAEGFDVIKILFGVRKPSKCQKYIPQSWCRICRKSKREANKDYYEMNRDEIDGWIETLLRFQPVTSENSLAKVGNQPSYRFYRDREKPPSKRPKEVNPPTPSFPMENEKQEMIVIDILEGLKEHQKIIIKHLVNEKGYNPMGFSVLVDDDRIFYMGKELLLNAH